MNLLMLLSALLSALTGVGGRVAAPPPVQAVAQEQAARVALPRPAAPRAARPAIALPPLTVVAAGVAPAPVTIAAIPAWTARRRE